MTHPVDAEVEFRLLIGPRSVSAGRGRECRARSTGDVDRTGTYVTDDHPVGARVEHDAFHSDWNYTVRPRRSASPDFIGAQGPGVIGP